MHTHACVSVCPSFLLQPVPEAGDASSTPPAILADINAAAARALWVEEHLADVSMLAAALRPALLVHVKAHWAVLRHPKSECSSTGTSTPLGALTGHAPEQSFRPEPGRLPLAQ